MFTSERKPERAIALSVAVKFAVWGIAWVLFTDVVLYSLSLNPVLVARFETAKGWIFVLLAAVLVYVVTFQKGRRLARANSTITAIIESIGDGVLLLGPNRTVEHVNPAALKLLGCEKREDVVGMSAAEFSRRFRVSYPNGALVPPEAFVSQRAFEEGGPVRYKEMFYSESGKAVVFSATAAAVRTEIGQKPELVVSVIHDITAEENIERTRNELFAAAAHSLKTPITTVRAQAELILRMDPKHAPLLATIVRQCSHIDRIVQNLLVMARSGTQTLEFHPSELRLRPFVQHIIDEMRPYLNRHSLQSMLTGDPTIQADQERLSMVIRNEIERASQTAPSHSKISVLLRQQGPHAEIGFRYRRLPIEEFSIRVFGDYDEISVGRKVSATIVEAHGGQTWEDTQGADSVSWVRLPLVA